MNHHIVKVATTEPARHFGDYLARARYGGDPIVVLKNRSPVAELRALPGTDCTLGTLLWLFGV